MKRKASISIALAIILNLALILTLPVNVEGSRTQAVAPMDGTPLPPGKQLLSVNVMGIGALPVAPMDDTEPPTEPPPTEPPTEPPPTEPPTEPPPTEPPVVLSTTLTVTCDTPKTYTGAAIEPCSAEVDDSNGSKVSGAAITLTYSSNIDVGQASVSASYEGDTTHTGSTGTGSFTIGPASSTVTVTCSNVTYTGSAQTPCTAVATGAGNLSVDVSSSLVYGNNTNAGAATASASWGGDSNHTGNTGSGGFTIAPAPSAVTVTCPVSEQYTGSAIEPCTASYKTDDGLSGSLTVTYTDNTNLGTATASASYDGDANHIASNASATFEITKADPTCTFTPYSLTYDGNPHTATGACTGVGGASDVLSGLDLTASTHTDANVYQDAWTFTDSTGLYNDASGTITDTIDKAAADCTVTLYSVTYDGSPHTATGTCTGIGGINLTNGLHLSNTTHTNAGDYPSDAWTLSDTNYTASGTIHDVITQADASCTVTPYAVPYDGKSHTATGTCTGIGGEDLSSGLDLGGTTHTNAGDYPSDAWTFTDAAGNYTNPGGTIDDNIAQVSATCTISGYTGVYDGAAHGASGTCVSAGGATLSGLTLGNTYTNVPGGTATWNFSNTNVSNSPQTGSVNIVISRAATTTTVSCSPGSFTYTGNTIRPCSATTTGPGLNQTTNLTSGTYYSTNSPTNVGTYTASYTYAQSNNWLTSNGSTTFQIIKAPSTVTVTCPTTAQPWTGSAITPCTAQYNGAGLSGGSRSVTVTYSNNTAIGTATASAIWGGDNNHNGSTGTGSFTIGKATSTVTVTCPASVTYNGSAQTPCTARATGAGSLSVDVSASLVYTNNTNAGTATASASWAGDDFHTGNTGSGTFTIRPATATCTVTPYNVPYDATAHTATYSCTANSLPLSGTLSGTTHTVVGTYNDNWTFTDSTGNYTASSSSRITDTITRAPTTTTVSCSPGTFTYTGSAIRPCTATTTGPGLNQTINLTNNSYYTPNPPPVNVGTYTASYTYAQTSNYLASNTGSATFQITQAPSTVTVTCPASVPYTGSPQTPCTAVVNPGGTSIAVTYLNNTDIGWATANASFAGDTNRAPASGSGAFQITTPTVACTVTGYSVTYDGLAHTVTTASCKASDGADVSSGINLSATAHTNAGTYHDTWTYHDINGNYADTSGSVTDTIAKANATCVPPSSINFNYIYDGKQHVGNETCTGVNGEDLSAQITVNFSFGNGIDVGISMALWSFNGGTNYNNTNGYNLINITQATATCNITGFTGVYDGAAHGATGTCTGVLGEDLSKYLTRGNTYTNVPGGTANWSFSSTNYVSQHGSVLITITQASSTVTVTCPASVPYTGSAQTPCTALATDATGALNKSLTVTYTNNTNVGTATASATFAGDVNHTGSSGSATFAIVKVDPKCTINPYAVPYDGKDHTATGSCQGVLGENLSGLDLTGTTHTTAGDYSDTWTFTDSTGNYNNASGTVQDTITKANAACTVTSYSVPYDGSAHTAEGSCTGIDGAPLDGLNLSNTTHTNAGDYNDTWTFTDSTGNYNDTSGTAHDSIAKADATCTVTPYNVTYDGNPHTATSSCTGVNGESLVPDLSGTTHTDAGDYPEDAWSFSVPNYNDLSGTIHDSIAKADAIIKVDGYTGPYDGHAHGATGSATGVKGEDLRSLLHLGDSFTNVPGGTADWTFDGNTNYNSASGSVDIVINKADPKCTIIPYAVPYDGNSHTAEGSCTGVDGTMMNGLDLTGTTHTNAGEYNNSWTFTASTGNYNDVSGTIHDSIAKIDATCTVTAYSVPYDGNSHTATGACTGLGGAPLSGLDLSGTTHTNAGEYNDPWTFTNSTGNYKDATSTVHDSIARLDATCTVMKYSVAYDGNPHTATGSCTGLGGATLSGLDLSGTTHTDAGQYTDTWTFVDAAGNYNEISTTIYDSITKVDATIKVEGYTGVFDGDAHGATGSATGVKGEDLGSLLHLGDSYINVPGGTAYWSFDGNTNYAYASGSVKIVITQADATCTVTPYSVTYDGNPHTASGSCTGVKSEILSGLVLSSTTHTTAGDYPGDAWTFSDSTGNYNDANGTVHDSIGKAGATCTVTPYSVTYDGNPHTATGSCTGIGGVALTGLDLSGTTHTNAGDYPSDAWNLSNVNYTASGTLHDSIGKADVTCTVTGYTVTYDGSAHTATGSCTGIGSTTLSGLDLSDTAHTDAGDYPGDAWVFNDITGNYNGTSGTTHDIINKADATCTISGYTVVYDGVAHGASGSCKGVMGEHLSGLDLGQSFTDVPGGTANWTFSNANYNNKSGASGIVINKAPSTTNVTCPASVSYTGSALQPCSALATGAYLHQATTVSYTNNTEIGTATANSFYAGDDNHTGSAGMATFIITLVAPTATPTATAVPPTSTPDHSKTSKGDSVAGVDIKAPLSINGTQVSTPFPTLKTAKGTVSDKASLTGGKSRSNNTLSTFTGPFGCLGAGFLGLIVFFMFKRRKKEEEEPIQ